MDTINHKNTNESQSFLAKWVEGKISDNQLIELIGKDEFLRYSKIIKGVEVNQKLNSFPEASLVTIKQKIHKRRSKAFSLYKKISIGVAAAVLISFGWFSFLNTGNTTNYYAEFGSKKSLILLDGSEVVLNSNSTLAYNKSNWKNNRTLELTGKAYFKVAKGKTFTVNTPNGSVQVLGTEFSVISYKNYFDVVCYEGKVLVKTEKENHTLTPKKTFKKIDKTITKGSVKEHQPTWLEGESSFKSVPLKYVLMAIEHQYGININSADINTSLLFTGSFSHTNLELALKTVLTSFNISFSSTSKKNIILMNKQ